MPTQVRYGVFHIDGSWCVIGDEFARLSFPTFSEALAATDVMVTAHRACGERCEVVIQDDVGRLIRMPDGEPLTLGPVAEAILAHGGRASVLFS